MTKMRVRSLTSSFRQRMSTHRNRVYSGSQPHRASGPHGPGHVLEHPIVTEYGFTNKVELEWDTWELGLAVPGGLGNEGDRFRLVPIATVEFETRSEERKDSRRAR